MAEGVQASSFEIPYIALQNTQPNRQESMNVQIKPLTPCHAIRSTDTRPGNFRRPRIFDPQSIPIIVVSKRLDTSILLNAQRCLPVFHTSPPPPRILSKHVAKPRMSASTSKLSLSFCSVFQFPSNAPSSHKTIFLEVDNPGRCSVVVIISIKIHSARITRRHHQANSTSPNKPFALLSSQIPHARTPEQVLQVAFSDQDQVAASSVGALQVLTYSGRLDGLLHCFVPGSRPIWVSPTAIVG